MRDNVFLVADHTGSAYWSDTPSSSRSRHSITEEQLVTHVEYLIDNIYVNIGNKCSGSAWEFRWVQIVRHY